MSKLRMFITCDADDDNQIIFAEDEDDALLILEAYLKDEGDEDEDEFDLRSRGKVRRGIFFATSDYFAEPTGLAIKSS